MVNNRAMGALEGRGVSVIFELGTLQNTIKTALEATIEWSGLQR